MFRKSSPPIEPRGVRRRSPRPRPARRTVAGRRRRRLVALLDPRPIGGGRVEREAQLDLAAVELADELEPCAREDARAAAFEAITSARKCVMPAARARKRAARAAGYRFPVPARRRRPRTPSPRSPARAAARSSRPRRHAPRPRRRASRAARRGPTSRDRPAGPTRQVDPADAVEAEVAALVGQPGEKELEQSVAVSGRRGSQPQRASVPEDDVDRLRRDWLRFDAKRLSLGTSVCATVGRAACSASCQQTGNLLATAKTIDRPTAISTTSAS